MSNIAVIDRMHFIPPHANGKLIDPIDIDFVKKSASVDTSESHTDYGKLYKIKVKFKVAGVTSTHNDLIKKLRYAESLTYTVINGSTTTIGSKWHRIQVSASEQVDGTPGGFVGYEVEIAWDSPIPYISQSFT